MKYIFILLLLISLDISSQTVQQVWMTPYYASGSSGGFIKTDNSGNAYVAGSYSGIDAPFFTFIQKLSPSGSQLFAVVLDTPCGMSSAFMDAADNIYICGQNYSWGPIKSSLVKYNSSGVLQWRKTEPVLYGEGYINMTGDPGGNLYVIKLQNGINKILKCNSAGVELQLINVADTLTAKCINYDAGGNIFIFGSGTTGSNQFSLITIKYSSAGVKLWKSVKVPQGGNWSWSSSNSKIHIGISGSIYITTNISLQPTTSDYGIIKYNSTNGSEMWTATFSRYQQDQLKDAATDNAENIYLAGSSGTVKFNSSGSMVWSDTTTAIAAMVLDNFGNIYVTGNEGNPSRIKTVKLDNNGLRKWQINYSTGGIYADYPNAITVDTSANVFVTGRVSYTPIPQYPGYTGTIKYAQFTGINLISSEHPAKFNLTQNYPNPFNPQTSIKFQIPKSGFVKLIAYDALGREVETVVNEQLQPGTYEADFDAGNLPSGVYYYKLELGEFTQTKKMVLIK